MTNDHTTKIMIWIHPNPMPMTTTPHSTGSNKQNSKEGKQSTNTNKHSQFNQHQQIMILCWIFHDHHDPHDHTTKIMICLATIPCHHVHPYLPINQQHSPNSKSFEFVMARAIVPWHSTIHHPPSSTAKTINNQHSNIWPWFLLIMVANTTAAHSSHTTPTSAKHKMQRKAKKQSKQLSPCSHHAIFQWLFLYSASNNGNRKGNAP